MFLQVLEFGLVDGRPARLRGPNGSRGSGKWGCPLLKEGQAVARRDKRLFQFLTRSF